MFYYCPNCWENLEESAVCCPRCGYELADYDQLPYEDKLLWALNHPVRENCMMAIEVLGQLGSQRAVPALREIVAATEDFYVAQAVVNALTRIGGRASDAALRDVGNHRLRIVRDLVGGSRKDARPAWEESDDPNRARASRSDRMESRGTFSREG